MEMKDINYYNTNADSFYNRTINFDMSDIYQKFLPLLPKNAYILDAGCGVGRDSKHFISYGYKVLAFDGSIEMVKYASSKLGQQVSHSQFLEIKFIEEFDGVWASASLLHVPYKEHQVVYNNIFNALKPNGHFYASYKYGDDYAKVDGREFYNMTENTILPYLKGLFEVVEIWQTPFKGSETVTNSNRSWLNVIVRKL